jgi:hypothetical protein
MWEYYLSYCEGAFRERYIGSVQMVLAKPGCRPSRDRYDPRAPVSEYDQTRCSGRRAAVPRREGA